MRWQDVVILIRFHWLDAFELLFTHFFLLYQRFFFFFFKPICMADKALTVSCLFFSPPFQTACHICCPRQIRWNVASCSAALLTFCFGALVLSWAVLQIQGLVWGGAPRRGSRLSLLLPLGHPRQQCMEKLIKTHAGRTPPTKQWDVTINKLQDVGSQLYGYIMLTYFLQSGRS